MSKIEVGRAGRRAPGSAAALAALALLLLPLGCVETVDGNGAEIDEPRDASGFERVTARGGLDVSIREGEFSVVVSIDANLQSYVGTSLDGDTLEIAVDDVNIGDKVDGPHVVISMPSLRDAETTGDGRLTVAEFEAAAPISLELTGSGELSWSGRATDLDAVLAGDGDLVLEGSADSAELVLRGRGTLDARELVAEEANVALDGTGALSVTVNGPVDASAANGGRVDLYGRFVAGNLDAATGGVIVEH